MMMSLGRIWHRLLQVVYSCKLRDALGLASFELASIIQARIVASADFNFGIMVCIQNRLNDHGIPVALTNSAKMSPAENTEEVCIEEQMQSLQLVAKKHTTAGLLTRLLSWYPSWYKAALDMYPNDSVFLKGAYYHSFPLIISSWQVVGYF